MNLAVSVCAALWRQVFLLPGAAGIAPTRQGNPSSRAAAHRLRHARRHRRGLPGGLADLRQTRPAEGDKTVSDHPYLNGNAVTTS